MPKSLRKIIYYTLLSIPLIFIIYVFINDLTEIKTYKQICEFEVEAIQTNKVSLLLPVKVINNISRKSLVSLGYVWIKKYNALGVYKVPNSNNLILVFVKKTKYLNLMKYVYFKITDLKKEQLLLEYIDSFIE